MCVSFVVSDWSYGVLWLRNVGEDSISVVGVMCLLSMVCVVIRLFML